MAGAGAVAEALGRPLVLHSVQLFEILLFQGVLVAERAVQMYLAAVFGKALANTLAS